MYRLTASYNWASDMQRTATDSMSLIHNPSQTTQIPISEKSSLCVGWVLAFHKMARETNLEIVILLWMSTEARFDEEKTVGGRVIDNPVLLSVWIGSYTSGRHLAWPWKHRYLSSSKWIQPHRTPSRLRRYTWGSLMYRRDHIIILVWIRRKLYRTGKRDQSRR